MIAFPSMLIGPAEAAGMKLPEDPDDYITEDFVHFRVFEVMQLGAPMPYPNCVWDNAQVIAGIPEERLLKMSVLDLIQAGFAIGNSNLYY